MSVPHAAFRAAVRSALAGLLDPSLSARFAAPYMTALLADARTDARTDLALAELVAALVSVGLPRGRLFVLLGGEGPPRSAEERARTLAASLAVPVLVHDPTAAAFTAGRLADGTPIALDDELREAEAIVSVGFCSGAAGVVRGGPYLLCPGVAAASTRSAFALERAARGEGGALAFAAAAEALVPVDLAVWWSDNDRVLAASGRSALECIARDAGLA